MGRLIYSMIASVDGYVADRDGHFASWARPDEEELAVINKDMADVVTYLYGRRMYEMMAVWETDPAVAAQSPQSEEFAKDWKAKNKIVYSTTLPDVHTQHTRLERSFDPETIREFKAASDADLTVDGPTLATEALRHGLVDEVHMLLCPVSIGGGLALLPDFRVDLRLLSEYRFTSGKVQLKYAVAG